MSSDLLQTPRLRLRCWRDSDLDSFAALNADARVMEFCPSPLSRAESDALARRIRELIDERGWGLWAVEVPGVSEFVGFVGLHVPTASLPFNPCVEVGWRLAFEHWGRGYATEGARAALRFGFEQLNLPEIVSFTCVGNRRSQAVMRRLGMRQDAHAFAHPSLPRDSPLSRHVLFRLARANWAASNGE